MANSLGSFTFRTLDTGGARAAAPELFHQRVAVIQRPGEAGSILRLLGIKGRPFQMRSFVDVANIATAVALHTSYQAAPGSGLLNLVWRDIDYDTVGVRFHVLEVRMSSLVPLRVSTSGAAAGLECAWTLLPESYSP